MLIYVIITVFIDRIDGKEGFVFEHNDTSYCGREKMYSGYIGNYSLDF